jgi:hypothetical protein
MIGHNESMKEDFTVADAQAMNEWAGKQPWVCSIGFLVQQPGCAKGKKKRQHAQRAGSAAVGISLMR